MVWSMLRAIVATRNACAGSITCENFTCARALSICSSLRAIGSALATSAGNSLDIDLTTANVRRKRAKHQSLRAESARKSIGNRDRRSCGNGSEEILGHEFRHPNAAVRCGIARKIARVHAGAAHDAHKIGHGRALEMCARWSFVVH